VVFAFSPSPSLSVALGTYAGSLLLVTTTAYASSRVMFRQKPEFLTILSSSALSFVPVAGLSSLLFFLQKESALGVLVANRTALTVLLALTQTWSALLLSSGMSVASGLRIEKTLIVGLALLYVSMSVLFMFGAV